MGSTPPVMPDVAREPLGLAIARRPRTASEGSRITRCVGGSPRAGAARGATIP